MRTFSLLAFGLCLVAICCPPANAAKTDSVVLINGNTVTGEIKSLEFGSLQYSTDSMGTVNIDWEDIVTLQSPQSLQVELTDGDRYFGSLATAETEFHVAVVTPSATYEFASREIVRMTPIDTSQSFVNRLDGSLSLGLTSQKSSEVTTFNLATDVSYRTTVYAVSFEANASLTDQPDRENSRRANTSLSYQRFRPNRWFSDWYSTFERNDELGIDGRVSVGGGYGRYIVQTNRNQLSLTAGVQATSEDISGEEGRNSVPEGRLRLRMLHRTPSVDGSLRFTSTAYPLLDDLSVFRAETDITFRRELINDLDWDVSIYHSYQSDPPVDAANSDYGVTTSIAFSF